VQNFILLRFEVISVAPLNTGIAERAEKILRVEEKNIIPLLLIFIYFLI